MDFSSFYSENVKLEDINKDIIKIHHPESSYNALYSICAPIEITYMCCNGIADSDYMNILGVSPQTSAFTFTSMQKFLAHHNKRSLHNHDYYEFMLVLDGQVTQRLENNEYSYHTGCGCMINRSVRHTEMYSGAAKIVFIGLSVQLISEILNFYTVGHFKEEQQILNDPIFKFMGSDIQASKGKIYFDFFPAPNHSRHSKILFEIVELMINTMLFPRFGASYILRGAICRLIQYLTDKDNYNMSQVQLDSREDFLLFSRITHLLEDHHGRISRKELENILNYSGSYINKVVKKYAGTSLFDYSMSFCMKRAEYLLKNTNRSVASIMSELHFSNTTHFYELFEKVHGCPPGQFRKQ